jgi:hypothetical protein
VGAGDLAEVLILDQDAPGELDDGGTPGSVEGPGRGDSIYRAGGDRPAAALCAQALEGFDQNYCRAAPAAPDLHELQIPNPEPLASMNAHIDVIFANSPALDLTLRKGVSVVANVPPGAAWRVVPQARRPGTSVPGEAASQLPEIPAEATSMIVIPVGTPGVSALLTRSLFAERVCRWLGVGWQVQQEINC